MSYTRDEQLGDLYSSLSNIFGKVGQVAQGVSQALPYAQQVASGESAIAIVPRGTTSTVVSGAGSPFALGLSGSAIPSWVIPVSLVAVVLWMTKRR